MGIKLPFPHYCCTTSKEMPCRNFCETMSEQLEQRQDCFECGWTCLALEDNRQSGRQNLCQLAINFFLGLVEFILGSFVHACIKKYYGRLRSMDVPWTVLQKAGTCRT